MKTFTWLAAAAYLAVASTASAHTHLKEAVPANGSTIAEPPANIVLTFTGAARITALTIQKDDGSAEQKVSALPETAAARISVPAPKLAPGKYTVNWRVVGADNHVMSGKLSFTIAASTAAKAPPASGT